MNRLQQLELAIDALPDEYNVLRNVLRNLLGNMALGELRTYSLGLLDMAQHLTSDEALLTPLRTMREVMK